MTFEPVCNYTEPSGDLCLQTTNNVMIQNSVIIFAVFMCVESYMIGNFGQRYVSKCSKFSIIHQVWGVGFAGYINLLVA
jgi:hypothetical protein